mmetsp:Transcript_62467/g.146848  ORF Transcript_62467/g.146848 Transcript_62467/m.146848 type:complete len:324 (-) Transcript_62467:2776-3747(-)
MLVRRHPLHRLRVLLVGHGRDRLADELGARLGQRQRLVHHRALVVRVVAHRHHLRRGQEMHDRLGLLHGHDDPALGLGLREESPVRPPNRQEHAAAHPVGEAMDKMIDGVGAMHVDGGDGVGEREELRHVALHQLVHVRHVADHQCALPKPGEELSAREEPEEEREVEGEEHVDEGVEGQGNVLDPLVLVVRDRGNAVHVLRAIAPHGVLDREHRRVSRHHRPENVRRGEKPRMRSLKDVEGPRPALFLQILGDGAGMLLAFEGSPDSLGSGCDDEILVEASDVVDVFVGDHHACHLLEWRRLVSFAAEVQQELRQRVVARDG